MSPAGVLARKRVTYAVRTLWRPRPRSWVISMQRPDASPFSDPERRIAPFRRQRHPRRRTVFHVLRSVGGTPVAGGGTGFPRWASFHSLRALSAYVVVDRLIDIVPLTHPSLTALRAASVASAWFFPSAIAFLKASLYSASPGYVVLSPFAALPSILSTRSFANASVAAHAYLSLVGNLALSLGSGVGAGVGGGFVGGGAGVGDSHVAVGAGGTPPGSPDVGAPPPHRGISRSMSPSSVPTRLPNGEDRRPRSNRGPTNTRDAIGDARWFS